MRPVPYVGHVQMGMQRDYMTEDQRFAATRPDVLVYQTPPLEEDLTVLGPIGWTCTCPPRHRQRTSSSR
jgi:uncharacterized protein